ncbi:MAG TPA: phospholipase D family protein [Rhodocyclaceae bacterium]|nr:phospholipase D family protein [Rhodocyclaceae bacterium]
MEARNLVQLIREAKPRTALFTTYTLSLSFFEAVLFPVLRQVGCRSISILVDANQAIVSLAEAHVKYAGRRYWLAPVVAPGGGVFHPKLSYLSGADVDVLAIGSGNLTSPGQSGQLETLDVVSSRTSPEVFRQFARFATGLADKIWETSPQAAGLLREYAQQSERAASASKAESLRFPDVPSLISTVEHPASAQIAALSEEAGLTLSSLTVLSPFHSPDAAPIKRLSQAVGVDSISIGLDPKKTMLRPLISAGCKLPNRPSTFCR